jgi:hypothetical protein
MKITSLACAVALFFAVCPAHAADDPDIARLATCRDSWLDWKKDPARLQKFGDHFRSGFSRGGNDPFFVPRTDKSIAGLRIVQAFPESVGMGVGFSVVVGASFEHTRKVMEKVLGKPLTKCEASDGMTTCELEIAEKRTFTLMAEDNSKATKTLVGCYYYYEK